MAFVATISRQRMIPSRAEAIWSILADFGALSSWVDGIAHSSLLHHGAEGPLGTSRRVQAGRLTLVETITAFDPPTTLAYEIEGLPTMVRAASNRWTLSPCGHATDVMVTSTYSVAGPLSAPAGWIVRRAMAKTSDDLLAGLAQRMESPDAF